MRRRKPESLTAEEFLGTKETGKKFTRLREILFLVRRFTPCRHTQRLIKHCTLNPEINLSTLIFHVFVNFLLIESTLQQYLEQSSLRPRPKSLNSPPSEHSFGTQETRRNHRTQRLEDTRLRCRVTKGSRGLLRRESGGSTHSDCGRYASAALVPKWTPWSPSEYSRAPKVKAGRDSCDPPAGTQTNLAGSPSGHRGPRPRLTGVRSRVLTHYGPSWTLPLRTLHTRLKVPLNTTGGGGLSDRGKVRRGHGTLPPAEGRRRTRGRSFGED